MFYLAHDVREKYNTTAMGCTALQFGRWGYQTFVEQMETLMPAWYVVFRGGPLILACWAISMGNKLIDSSVC